MAQVCSARLSQSDWRVSLRRGDHMGGGQPVQCTVQYSTGPAHCTLYCRKQTQKELLCPDDSTVSVFTLTWVLNSCSKQAQCVQSAIQLYCWLLCPCLGPAQHTSHKSHSPRRAPRPCFSAPRPRREIQIDQQQERRSVGMEHMKQGGDNPSYDPLTVIRAKQNM